MRRRILQPERPALLVDALHVVLEVLDRVLEDVDQKLRPVLRVNRGALPRFARQAIEVGSHLLALYAEEAKVEFEIALVIPERTHVVDGL